MSSLSMICAAKSEQGRRSSNDDCILVDPEAGLYVVCDGARGRFGGHTAAELAVDTFRGCLGELRQVDIISPAAEKMIESMALKAHRRILAAQQQDSSLEGTTTTMAAVLHRGAQVLVSHVGDTRIYLHREGELQLLTVDHNLENYLLENPNFRPKVQLSGKTLVRALGLKTSALTVDHKSVNLQKGDKLLINTDGLTDSLPGMTMRHIMATLDLRSEQDVADSLVRAALNHGSMDNISVILLHSTDRAVDGPKTTIFEVASLTSTASVKSVVLGWLTFLDEPQRGRVVTLESKTVIGADSNCKIVVAEDYVSARHAEVLRTEHGYVLRDLGSTNGSFINNVSAKNEYCLVDGDVIRIGSRELVFKSLRVDQ